MFRGGRAFTKPLPFALGTNGGMLAFTTDTVGINYAQQCGMTIYRNDMPWTYTKGVFQLETTPGNYNSANIAAMVTLTATLRASGFTPLYLVEQNQSPAMCPTLSSALSSGTVYTSISVTKLPYAITSGDSIVITDPANQAHTQTIVAASSMAKGASGSLAVNSFTAGFNFPAFVASTTNPPVLGASGSWVYDTTWPACTPQHLANTMAMLCGTTGLKGLHWELFNEPDGLTWGTDATLVTQAYKLAYPAMKAADPTCVVHGICPENLAPIGYPEGTAYYELCVLAGILGYYDILSFHQYSNNATGGQLDGAPDSPNIWGSTFWQMIANFQAIRIAKGDNTPMWLTEVGFQSGARSNVASGSNGVNVNTFTGSGVLNVQTTTNFTGTTGSLTVPTSGGIATITYTGTGTNTITGCNFVSGDAGTLSTGAVITGLTNGQMTPQIQAQFFQNLLTVLSGNDPINGVPFSSYLKAVLQFQMTGNFQNWSVIDQISGTPGTPKPVFNVFQQLVNGH